MNFNIIKYFIAVADSRSFSKAAKQNFVSQTDISQQISKLEGELETKLFDRSNIPIRLTKSGEKIYQRAKLIDEQWELMKRDVQPHKIKKQTIRIGFIEGTMIPLKEILINALAREDSIEVEITKVSAENVEEYLIQGVVDIMVAFSSNVTQTDKIDTTTILEGNFYLVANDKNPLTKQDSVSVGDVEKQPLIYIAKKDDPTSLQVMQKRLEKRGLSLHLSALVDSIDVALFLVSLNRGVTFTPEYEHTSTEFFNLRKLKIKDNPFRYRVCLAYQKTRSDLIHQVLSYIQ